MTVPRELTMSEVDVTYMVLSSPVTEFDSLIQVEHEEAELFLTPGMTWTSTGNLAQAEVEFYASNSFEEAELFPTPGMTWTSTGNLAQAEVEFYASNSFEIVVSNAETNEAIQFNYNHQNNAMSIM